MTKDAIIHPPPRIHWRRTAAGLSLFGIGALLLDQWPIGAIVLMIAGSAFCTWGWGPTDRISHTLHGARSLEKADSPRPGKELQC